MYYLKVDANQLAYLNVKNGNNSNFVLFEAQTNPNLTCIEVDNIGYSTSTWTNIDSTSSFNNNCNITYVPDNNFENYLETHDANGNIVTVGTTNSMGNGIANDDYVTTTSINTVTILLVNSVSISDITGIEDFVALTTLDCSDNNLTNLNVSQNTLLIGLACQENQITSLDVTQNTNLIDLFCFDNALTTLDIRQNLLLSKFYCNDNALTNIQIASNTSLTQLYCHNNVLTTLDVSQSAILSVLYCNNNAISSINVSSNSVLNRLFCTNNALTSLNAKNGNNINFLQFDARTNPNLVCIEVDDAAWSTNNWTNIDSISNFSTNCNAFGLTDVPDDNFEAYLEANGMGNGIANDNYVTTANISTVTNLNVSNLSILDLTGIGGFSALTHLNCSNNLLISLDLRQNIALTVLQCNNNALTSILLKSSSKSNQSNGLDLSQNSSLVELDCSSNQLTYLNVKNGNNTSFTEFNATNNPNLTCVEVDDVAWSVANWTNIDATTTFVSNQTECSTLSTDTLNSLKFELYPNPTSGKITIEVLEKAELKIYSVLGKEIKRLYLNNGKNEINNLNLAKGIYLFKVVTKEKTSTKKVIVNK
ncbi:T9SS type A sorting domain-containing protein [Polaribacter glomeratus]|uniref:Secretion system C-terminal sorting domain-containing protein n=1 Tax=Polaribacter glomeratus TaxID=102 RepID=A0A2S7WW42_9FLAO|nr:T9SS type A sorting domain-containing protein [Polaribacter glomeratus]PQJ81788.1 hypothetical protein BTO16_04025 [Polaribacter glomeratus]TXD66289.1 T9SS type A sorting domain-containing protein [Polaribacter glomeratus]